MSPHMDAAGHWSVRCLMRVIRNADFNLNNNLLLSLLLLFPKNLVCK